MHWSMDAYLAEQNPNYMPQTNHGRQMQRIKFGSGAAPVYRVTQSRGDSTSPKKKTGAGGALGVILLVAIFAGASSKSDKKTAPAASAPSVNQHSVSQVDDSDVVPSSSATHRK